MGGYECDPFEHRKELLKSKYGLVYTAGKEGETKQNISLVQGRKGLILLQINFYNNDDLSFCFDKIHLNGKQFFKCVQNKHEIIL